MKKEFVVEKLKQIFDKYFFDKLLKECKTDDNAIKVDIDGAYYLGVLDGLQIAIIEIEDADNGAEYENDTGLDADEIAELVDKRQKFWEK